MQRAATATRANDPGETTYEIMVCSTIDLPGQVTKDSWYIAGAFRSLGEATVNYEAFCRQYPDRRLLVALVRSTFDEETRRFHDRVLDAREPVQRLLRSSRELTPAARSRLQEEFGKAAPRGASPKPAEASEPRARRGDVVRPAAKPLPPPEPAPRGKGAFLLAALAAAAALAGAAWLMLQPG